MLFKTAKTKFLRYFLKGISYSVLFLALESLFFSASSLAANQLSVRYVFFEQSLPIADLRTYAEKDRVSSSLQSFLSYLSADEQKAVRQFLQVKMPLDIVAVDKLLDTEIGKKVLSEAAKVTVRRDKAGVSALRSAVINGLQAPGGLGVISFLEAYPSQKIVIDLPQANNFITAFSPLPEEASRTKPQDLPQDNLSSTLLWQLEVQYQAIATSNKQYNSCLFGDSISAGLGNIGSNTFNFALNGLSTVSLIEQGKVLNSANVKCQQAIIAIGTNDAMYGISDNLFIKKMKEAIALVKATGAKRVVLIPAFYSTVAASKNSNLAGTISRINEINALIRQVAQTENIPIEAEGIQPLFKGQALKDDLTVDGVHLNDEGLKIYRQALLTILGSNP